MKQGILNEVKGYYLRSFKILRKNKRVLLFAIFLYVVFFIGSLAYYGSTYEGFSSEESEAGFQEFWKSQMIKETFSSNVANIVGHNLIATLFRIVFGLLLGIFPTINLIDGAINDGYGLVADVLDGTSLTQLGLSRLHFIGEVPAFILSSALGMMVFLSLFKSKSRLKDLIEAYKNALLVWATMIAPLIVVSAIIESILIMFFWF